MEMLNWLCNTSMVMDRAKVKVLKLIDSDVKPAMKDISGYGYNKGANSEEFWDGQDEVWIPM